MSTGMTHALGSSYTESLRSANVHVGHNGLGIMTGKPVKRAGASMNK